MTLGQEKSVDGNQLVSGQEHFHHEVNTLNYIKSLLIFKHPLFERFAPWNTDSSAACL